MKINKKIGVLVILLGVLVLFYKSAGFYGFGGYVYKSWENIIISLILIAFGIILIRRRKKTE